MDPVVCMRQLCTEAHASVRRKSGHVASRCTHGCAAVCSQHRTRGTQLDAYSTDALVGARSVGFCTNGNTKCRLRAEMKKERHTQSDR
eukprot:173304-Pleurochrysis_carterae.AAC.4